jgi:hypothetical protein
MSSETHLRATPSRNQSRSGWTSGAIQNSLSGRPGLPMQLLFERTPLPIWQGQCHVQSSTAQCHPAIFRATSTTNCAKSSANGALITRAGVSEPGRQSVGWERCGAVASEEALPHLSIVGYLLSALAVDTGGLDAHGFRREMPLEQVRGSLRRRNDRLLGSRIKRSSSCELRITVLESLCESTCSPLWKS